MAKFLGVNISSLVNKHLSPKVFDVVITELGTYNRASSLSIGTRGASSTYTAKGFIDEFRYSEIDGTRIQAGDHKVLIIADSVSSSYRPKLGNQITLQGRTLTIVSPVMSDPAQATYTCHCRG